jgi:hypothetical protein
MPFQRTGTGVLAVFFLICPAAFADIVSTATLNIGQTLNLDKGTVASVAVQGGDLLLSSGTLSLLGSASGTVLGNGTMILYNVLTQQLLQAASTNFQQTPIPTSSLVANAGVIEMKTNGGNYAKLLVTASSSSSISFQYTTYGATASGGGTPTITAVQNNYSFIAQGLPNYGIAPGALFIVKGTNLNNQPLSALQSSASPGLPLTFNGTSVSVTVNGTTVQPGIYYTSPTQLGLVLPSTTPVGTGTITVTNNGTPSTTGS